MSDPVGLNCPGCGEPPAFLFGDGSQAICATEGCRWLIWDPTRTIAELNASVQVIELPGGGDD